MPVELKLSADEPLGINITVGEHVARSVAEIDATDGVSFAHLKEDDAGITAELKALLEKIGGKQLLYVPKALAHEFVTDEEVSADPEAPKLMAANTKVITDKMETLLSEHKPLPEGIRAVHQKPDEHELLKHVTPEQLSAFYQNYAYYAKDERSILLPIYSPKAMEKRMTQANTHIFAYLDADNKPIAMMRVHITPENGMAYIGDLVAAAPWGRGLAKNLYQWAFEVLHKEVQVVFAMAGKKANADFYEKMGLSRVDKAFELSDESVVIGRHAPVAGQLLEFQNKFSRLASTAHLLFTPADVGAAHKAVTACGAGVEASQDHSL